MKLQGPKCECECRLLRSSASACSTVAVCMQWGTSVQKVMMLLWWNSHFLYWKNGYIYLTYCVSICYPKFIFYISDFWLLQYLFCFHTFQCSDASSGSLGRSAVSERRLTTMSADSNSGPELDSEHNGELADLVAAMNVTSNHVTPLNGHRSGPPRAISSHRARLSDRKMSLQEKGSRIPRQRTIETKRVSITDADVRLELDKNDTQSWIFFT